MIDLEQFTRLKEKADAARSEADRAQGVLDEQMKKLKADYKVETIEAAEVLLRNLEQEEKLAEAEYDKELAAFELKWKDKI